MLLHEQLSKYVMTELHSACCTGENIPAVILNWYNAQPSYSEGRGEFKDRIAFKNKQTNKQPHCI